MTAVDAEGYPKRSRGPPNRAELRALDAETGQMSVAWPAGSRSPRGRPASCATPDDEKVWNIKAMQIRKGRIERRAGDWVFISTAFTPPRGLLITFLRLSRNGRTAARRYLDKRGLTAPAVNWDAIDELQRRARNGQSQHT